MILIIGYGDGRSGCNFGSGSNTSGDGCGCGDSRGDSYGGGDYGGNGFGGGSYRGDWKYDNRDTSRVYTIPLIRGKRCDPHK